MHNHKDGGLKLKVLQHAKRKHQHELHAESDMMRYTGVDYGSEASAARASGALLVGVHEKSTGKVSIVPASSLYLMKPSVKQPRVSLVPGAASSSGSAPAATAAATKRDLVESLGAAKALKKQRQLQQAAVKVDAIFNASSLGSDIKTAADAADNAGAGPDRSARDLHPLHPPFNAEATTLAAAYPRSGLVPEALWKVLDYSPLKALAKSAEQRDKFASEPGDLWPAFVLAELGAPLPADKSARHERMKLLAFLTHLLRFATLRAVIKPKRRNVGLGAADSAEGHNDDHPDARRLRLPSTSWERLLAEYTEPAWSKDGAPPQAAAGDDEDADEVAKPAARKITPSMRDKIALHVFTLGLHLGGGQLACAALASSLGLTEERCVFFLRQLGCHVKRMGGAKVAVLQLPLEFPKLSRGAPQQRR